MPQNRCYVSANGSIPKQLLSKNLFPSLGKIKCKNIHLQQQALEALVGMLNLKNGDYLTLRCETRNERPETVSRANIFVQNVCNSAVQNFDARNVDKTLMNNPCTINLAHQSSQSSKKSSRTVATSQIKKNCTHHGQKEHAGQCVVINVRDFSLKLTGQSNPNKSTFST